MVQQCPSTGDKKVDWKVRKGKIIKLQARVICVYMQKNCLIFLQLYTIPFVREGI
jgi:hypothetical protein